MTLAIVAAVVSVVICWGAKPGGVPATKRQLRRAYRRQQLRFRRSFKR